MNDLERPSILDAQYDSFDPHAIAAGQTHLSPQQCKELGSLLAEFPTLFDGTLRTYPRSKVHIELLDQARPVHQRAYPVPHINLEAFKHELDHLCTIGVLEKCGASEWASPTFIIPKKDGRVRWVSDFRELNKCIRRRIYPLPRIQDILWKRKGYKFFSKLDVSMQYYTFELDDESKDLCVIATPFGLFRYCRLPMGIKTASDLAQEAMEKAIQGIDEADCYIDDVGIWNDSWSDHLKTLRRVLQRLQDDGFAINVLKGKFGVQETDWLGYWLTPIELKPWRKKVDAIINLAPPANLTGVRSFIGAVTYYRDMFPHRSHLLAPLTDLTKGAGPKKRKITWTAEHQIAFDKMKALIARDVLMRYPDHNLPFHIYTDASDLQLGSVILQNGAPVAYYSRKLNAAQRNYSVIEKELLSIVETLKEYRTMLYGCAELHIYTDHKNLTYHKLSSQKVMRWRLFIEEFQPQFHYVKGADNAIADALSRLPRTEGQGLIDTQAASPGVTKNFENFEFPRADTTPNGEPVDPTFALNSHHFSSKSEYDLRTTSNESNQHDNFIYAFSVATDDDAMLECLLNFPDLDYNTSHPLDYQAIATAQQNDAGLLQKLETNPTKYSREMVEDVDFNCLHRYA